MIPIKKILSVSRNFIWALQGHYYSPIPSADDTARAVKKMSEGISDAIPGIDLNLASQRELLNELVRYYQDLPFPESKNKEFRYYYKNPNYLYSDAIFLNCMIRHFHPKNVVEIGSGFSSCCILDTNEYFMESSIRCTFLEPFPKLFRSLIRREDEQKIEVLPLKLQDAPLELFDRLGENDLLVIDSTHVMKSGSDVECIFAEVLPRLKRGVLIHFHDIFYPFEYPIEWLREGRAWNEAYALRNFLQYNDAFEIVCFNTYLEYLMPEYFAENMPLCLKNTGGSIWIRKIR